MAKNVSMGVQGGNSRRSSGTISDEKLIRIEKKVADILKESADQARKLIEDNKELATKLITRLTRQYSLTREEIRRIFRSVKNGESQA